MTSKSPWLKDIPTISDISKLDIIISVPKKPKMIPRYWTLSKARENNKKIKIAVKIGCVALNNEALKTVVIWTDQIRNVLPPAMKVPSRNNSLNFDRISRILVKTLGIAKGAIKMTATAHRQKLNSKAPMEAPIVLATMIPLVHKTITKKSMR